MRGLSYTHIAAEMGCEMSTVKFHVANMLQKTGFENKLQLALDCLLQNRLLEGFWEIYIEISYLLLRHTIIEQRCGQFM